MLVSRCHSDVFVPKQLSYRVYVCSFHPEPACRRVTEVMKPEIRNAYRLAGPDSGGPLLSGSVGQNLGDVTLCKCL